MDTKEKPTGELADGGIMALLATLVVMEEAMVAEENKNSTEYLEKLFSKLHDMLLSDQDSLKQVILKKEAPKFHFSINDKMYIEIKSGAELYLMKSKEAKEGKVYVFFSLALEFWSGFLILEEYLEDLEPN